jgi:hypothetical protein
MKKGLTLQELAEKIETIKDSKVDYVAPSNKLTATVVEESKEDEANLLDSILDQTERARKEKELEEKKPKRDVRLSVENGDSEPHIILPYAHGQIAGRLKIPKPYHARCLSQAPDLLTTNINHWFQNQPEDRMVRTLIAPYADTPTVRAFLSNRYRRIENELIAEAILPIIYEMAPKLGLEIQSCEITDTRMYIQVRFPKIEREVRVGDIVQAGLGFRNSEVGAGSVTAEQLIWRLECMNGQVGQLAIRKYHVGRRIDTDEEVTQDFYRDETLKADDKALLMKIQDTVRHSFDEGEFDKSVDAMRDAASRQITGTKILDTVKVLDKKCNLGLSDGEQNGVLHHLISGGDMTQWGVSNAITRMAHEEDTNYNRCYEYQKMGAKVVNMNGVAWDTVMNAIKDEPKED